MDSVRYAVNGLDDTTGERWPYGLFPFGIGTYLLNE